MIFHTGASCVYCILCEARRNCTEFLNEKPVRPYLDFSSSFAAAISSLPRFAGSLFKHTDVPLLKAEHPIILFIPSRADEPDRVMSSSHNVLRQQKVHFLRFLNFIVCTVFCTWRGKLHVRLPTPPILSSCRSLRKAIQRTKRPTELITYHR
jgi:hypothetical protein